MAEPRITFVPPDPGANLRKKASSRLAGTFRTLVGFDECPEIEVRFAFRGDHCRCTLKSHIKDLTVQRRGEGDDPGAAVERAADAMERVIEKHRDYLLGYTARTPVMEFNILAKPLGPSGEGEPRNHFVKKLPPGDAVKELDLRDGPGLIFYNTETGRPTVLLNHGEGHFEMLEPSQATAGRAGVETSLAPDGERERSESLDNRSRPKGKAPRAAMPSKLHRLRPHLRCPGCLKSVEDREGGLYCPECGRTFEIRSGVPVMVADPRHDPEPGERPVSRNPYGQQTLKMIEKQRNGLVLDCGSGCPPVCFENVIHLEIVRYPGVDIVADGEHLPFADACFDAVISEAVLEHVPDPFAYAAELHRVLKPGGEIRVDAAFLQPYHAYPHHYFNMTISGLELLMKNFVKIDSGCGPHQQPIVTLGLVLQGILDGIDDPDLRKKAAKMPLSEVLRIIGHEGDKEPFQTLSKEAVAKLGAGFYFYGYK